MRKKYNMKQKVARLILSILTGIVAAVVLAFVILWFVPNAANADAKDINDNTPIDIFVITGGTYPFESGTSSTVKEYLEGDADTGDAFDKIFDAYKQSIKYPIMYGIMENQWFPGFKITQDTDADGVVTPHELTKADVNAVTGTAEEPLLVFRYGSGSAYDTQVFKYKDITLEYNLIYLKTSNSNNELAEYKIYFVNSYKMVTDAEEYITYEFTGLAKTTLVYDAVIEAAK
ncbi:MAG: hypothetical protein LBS99_03985 [Clostridiales bacterium]|nr:hypothetical protein [Clostridiales bacterium]